MAKIVYKILDESFDFRVLRGIVSMVTIQDLTIVARYGVNKTTLRKILRKYIGDK